MKEFAGPSADLGDPRVRVRQFEPEDFPQPVARNGFGAAQARPQNNEHLKPVSVASFADQPIPPREMHVKDLVPTKNVTLLSGDGGTGKSLLAAQLAAATVLYTPWLGQEVLGGSVVYLCAEDDMPELHRRFADIARHHGVGLDSLGGIEICCLAGKDAVLAIVNTRGVIEPTALWAEFRRIVIDVRPALVIYDPLADLFGGNEIVRTQARQFVTMLRGLALETDSTALLLGQGHRQEGP
jgi:RecA-family ATPase